MLLNRDMMAYATARSIASTANMWAIQWIAVKDERLGPTFFQLAEPKMETINHKLPPTVLDNNTTLNGMVVGDLTVVGGVYVMMNGMVTGDLIARQGSSVDVNGTVSGCVVNEGGHVKVQGVVGRIIDTGSEATVVHPNAVVKNA